MAFSPQKYKPALMGILLYTDVISRLANGPAYLPVTRDWQFFFYSWRQPVATLWSSGHVSSLLISCTHRCRPMTHFGHYFGLYCTRCEFISESTCTQLCHSFTSCVYMVCSSIVPASTSCLWMHDSHNVMYCDFILKGSIRCETSDVSSPVVLCSATL